jgi:hypothetical protein
LYSSSLRSSVTNVKASTIIYLFNLIDLDEEERLDVKVGLWVSIIILFDWQNYVKKEKIQNQECKYEVIFGCFQLPEFRKDYSKLPDFYI